MRTVGQAVGAALFGAVINFGISYYDPQLGSVAERLMDPTIRIGFHDQELLRLTSTLSLALRNVYVISALVGVALVLLGCRFPSSPASDDA
jgi:hypothetical protein